MTLRYAVVSATGGQGGAVTAALGDAGALLRGIARRLESLRAQERLSVHSVGRVLSGRTRWILRLVRAAVPGVGEPLFRCGVSHCDAAG